MAGRYLVTGVQLGMLLVIDEKDRKEILDKIMKEQFIGTSDNGIIEDCKLVEKGWINA